MSDPVTNVEIEDVLSSIRKLVSQGDEPRARDSAPRDDAAPDPAQTEEPAAASDAKPAKLLLTPAQLVETGATEISEATPQRPEAAAPHVLEHPIAAAQETETHEVDNAPQSQTAADDPDTDLGAPAADDGEDAALVDTSLANLDTMTQDNRRTTLEATIAELEASVGGSDFEPDGSEVADHVETLTWPGHHPRINEVEQAVSAPSDSSDPTADAPSNEETTADDLAAPYDEDIPNLSALDEESLRDLVAEIVREELQGALGERITRNVRKLVRREIYRILSSQDFD
ncbi:MAG: hypothetical protein GVY31_11345 [Alphaproteobacteria bacterium]|jgi:cell pole-organizing protein PopZ|nr:hypothetical protein [Alphaproteobacteria bacterium]